VSDIALKGVNLAGMYLFDVGSSTAIGVGAQLRYSRWFVVRIDYTAYPLELFGDNVVVKERDDKFTFVMGVPFGSN
jgi:hypothetical protein